MEKILKIVKKEKFFLSLLFASFVLRLFFMSPWLEDWDSVQFALGLHDFSIIKHQPHPPGYPLYILLGRLSYFLLRDDTRALTFLSSISGSLAAVPLYFLAKRMFNKSTAILATLIFVLTPVEWILSETPISNIVGLFFLLILAYLAYVFSKDERRTLFVGLIAGVILGVRFTDFPIVAGLLGLLIIKNRRLKYLVLITLGFIAGLVSWLVPLILKTGLRQFIDALGSSASYVWQHDVLFGRSPYLLEHILLQRLRHLGELLNTSYTAYFLALSVLTIIWMMLKKAAWKQLRYQFLFIWLLSYGLPLVFFYNLELPGYTLPLLPPLAIIVASMFNSWITKANKGAKLIPVVAFIFLLIILITRSWPELVLRTKTLPPTIAPVLYVQENFDPKETTLVTSFTYRQFQYYAPQFKNYYGAKNAPENIETKTVIIDYEGLKDQIPALGKYRMQDTKEFSNPEFFFSRLKKTNLYILDKE